jgi:ABC-type spermidine/putrescine transport system permease subunit II
MLAAQNSMLVAFVVAYVAVAVAVLVLAFPEREDFREYIPE